MLATINRNCNAGDAFCLGEIEHRGSDVVRPRAALKWQTLSLCRKLHIGLARAGKRGARCHCIHSNFRRQCLCQRYGRGVQCAFTQRVREEVRSWPQYALIDDIDDRCVHSGRCLRREGLRKKQWRCQVDGNGTLEARGRQSFDIVRLEFASVIDQKSELPKSRRPQEQGRALRLARLDPQARHWRVRRLP